MSSIGADAYGGTLTLDTLNYTNLNPPIGGFVNNPLTGNLDCGGNDLTNAGAITTGTLNYTILNPPIPTGFVNNPMTVLLDGGNQDINNVNAISGAIVATTGNITVGGKIVVVGAVEAGSGVITNNFDVNGNLTVENTGLTTLKGGLVVASAGNSTFNNRVIFNASPSYKPSIYGTVGVPISLTPLTPAAGITTHILNPNTSSVIVFGHPDPTINTYSTMEISTPYTDVLEHYSVEVTQQTINSSAVVQSIPNLSLTVGSSDKTPADKSKFQFVMEHGAVYSYTSQILMYVIKLNFVV